MRFASRGGSRFKIDLRAKFRDQAERVSRERGLGFGAERDRDRRRRAGLFPAKRPNEAAPESNLPSRGLHDRTDFEDRHRESPFAAHSS